MTIREIRFLPSYVGSKRHWLTRLGFWLDGQNIVEPFCGSAVLSANFAARAILNDTDPMLHKVLAQFGELEVPATFTREDYYRVRGRADWWRWAYCLQGMSYSGVWRHSRNGYNVPAKPLESVSLRPTYERALTRMQDLNPLVSNMDYTRVIIPDGWVAVIDPPYEKAQAAYNKDGFCYQTYWSWVRDLMARGLRLAVFDTASNLEAQGIPAWDTRKMRVNGARDGNIEACALFDGQRWESKENTP